MNSNTRLDHALFQLTPTRTRCDLLVFSGELCEKLASGLLEPFLSHLRCAKQQIPKGGYSITLRPETRDPSWFTKGTLERFVRFVSTPEILERFASIEREISHIENSINLNDYSTSTAANPSLTGQAEQGNITATDGTIKKSNIPPKSKGEPKDDEAAQEENSKLRLQRVLETRKAVLRKEQAMAYARAVVAGFEENHIDDLIAFADAFGASRLREACFNFKDLCMKKHGDGLWMDELAAIEACTQPELSYMGASGIMLTSHQSLITSMPNTNDASNGQLDHTGSSDASTTNSTINHANSNVSEENNLPASSQTTSAAGNGDTFHVKTQVPVSWPNPPPPYMYNFQNPVVPQMHPYQGYPLAGMHAVPLYYGNMHFPPHLEESGYGGASHHSGQYRHRSKSSRKNDVSMNGEGAEVSDPTSRSSDHVDSSSGSEADAGGQEGPPDGNPLTMKQQKKGRGKKSSRTVIIRNINYISSKKRDGDKDGISDESSAEDDFIDGDSIKQKLEDVVDSLQKHQKSNQRHSKRSSCKHSSDAQISNDASEQYVENGCEGEKRNENWKAFQSLLMRDEDSGSNNIEQDNGGTAPDCNNPHVVDVQDEYCVIKSSEFVQPFDSSCTFDAELKKGVAPQLVASDSFVVTDRDTIIDDAGHLENFECDENYCKNLKRSNCIDGELLLSQRLESDSNVHESLSDYSHESSLVLKSQKGGDWFIISQPEKSADGDVNAECSMFDGDRSLSISGDCLHTEKNRRDFMIDDSIVVPTRTEVDYQPHSQWRTDISFITDFEPMGQQESVTSVYLKDKNGTSGVYEPDDLYMVLERDPRHESIGESWTPEIDYSMDVSLNGGDKRDFGAEANGHVESVDGKMPSNQKNKDSKDEGDPKTKHSSKDARSKPLQGSLMKTRSDILSRNKRPSAMSREAILKSKMEKEEENRKKKEELLIERQKRIAQRSGASCTMPATSKNDKVESKTSTRPLRNDKQTSRPTVQQVKKLSSQKSEFASSTKERLASGQGKHKLSTITKSIQPKSAGKKGDSVAALQSPGEKTMKAELSNSSVKDSSNADLTSDLHISAEKERFADGQVISTEKDAVNMETSSLPAINFSDGVQISTLDTSSTNEEQICSDLKETSVSNAAVQDNSSLLDHPPSSLVANGQDTASHINGSSDKIQYQDFGDSSLPLEDHSTSVGSQKQLKVDFGRTAPGAVGSPRAFPQFHAGKKTQDMPASQVNGCINDASLPPNSSQNHHISFVSVTEFNSPPMTLHKPPNSVDVAVEEKNVAEHENFPVSCEISEIEMIPDSVESTPPPTDGINSESLHSRKKWTSSEGHPAAKGIKKLLMFGRKSRSSAAC